MQSLDGRLEIFVIRVKCGLCGTYKLLEIGVGVAQLVYRAEVYLPIFGLVPNFALAWQWPEQNEAYAERMVKPFQLVF